MNLFLLQADPGPDAGSSPLASFLPIIIILAIFVPLGIKIGKVVVNAVEKNISLIIGIGTLIIGIALIIINITNIIDLLQVINLGIGTGAIIRAAFLIVLGVFLSASGLTCMIAKKKTITVNKDDKIEENKN
jgi:hypothetical protein